MKKIFAVLLSIMILASVSVVAEGGLTVSALLDTESGKVVFSGNGSGAIVLYVLPYEKNADHLSATDLPIDVIGINAPGEYKVYSKLSSESCGKLRVIATDMYENRAEAVFMFADFNISEEELKEINDADTGSKLQTAAEKVAENVGIDTEDEFYKENASEIFRVQRKIKDEYSSATDFYENYNKAYALVKMGGSKQSECEDILRSGEIYLGISYEDDYTNDERLDDNIKKELMKILASEDFADALEEMEFWAYFENAKALAAVKGAEKWQDIKDVIENDFADLFDLEETNLKLQSVYSKMMGYEYKCFEDIEEGYNKAVKSLKKPVSTGGSSSSGGGYGGGSSGGVGVSSNVDIKLPETEQSETKDEKKPMITLPTDGKSNFSDVPESHWGYKAISALSTAGVIKGYENGAFLPSDSITRAEFTKLVAVSFGLGEKKANFEDVSENAWYNGVIGAASDAGVILGFDGKFNPEGKITRQDAVVICYRILKNEGIILSGNADFEDNMAISVYALSAVGAFKEYGIVKGDGKNFSPVSPITRAEAAQLIVGVLEVAASYKGV